MKFSEPFEHKGYWWKPNNPDNKVAGVLTYKPGESIVLELIGTFDKENDAVVAFLNKSEEIVIYGASQYTTTGDAEGFFLEPAGPSTTKANRDKRIPEGVYNVDKYSSADFPDNFILSNKNVSKDRGILIHTRNTGKDTAGCLLPVNMKGQGSVSESRKNMSILRSFIKKHNNKPIN